LGLRGREDPYQEGGRLEETERESSWGERKLLLRESRLINYGA